MHLSPGEPALQGRGLVRKAKLIPGNASSAMEGMSRSGISGRRAEGASGRNDS